MHRAMRKPMLAALGGLAAGVVLTSTLFVGIAIGGGAGFTDVPEDHPFKTEIDAIADAGISEGFGDGTFRPSQAVTRQAMAAFMLRGFGRVDAEQGQTTLTDEFETVEQVDITAGATGGGTGNVLLLATGDLFSTDGEDCPCRVELRLRQAGEASPVLHRYVTLQAGEDDEDATTTSFASQVVIAVPAGTTSFLLEGRMTDADDPSIVVTAELSGLYVPFDGDGTPADVVAPDEADTADARG